MTSIESGQWIDLSVNICANVVITHILSHVQWNEVDNFLFSFLFVGGIDGVAEIPLKIFVQLEGER